MMALGWLSFNYPTVATANPGLGFMGLAGGTAAGGTVVAVDTAPLKTPLQEAEDTVSRFINGGGCTATTHNSATQLEKLIMLKMLRMEMPHQSTQESELNRAIRKEAEKHAK